MFSTPLGELKMQNSLVGDDNLESLICIRVPHIHFVAKPSTGGEEEGKEGATGGGGSKPEMRLSSKVTRASLLLLLLLLLL